jgi:transcription initiation factor TFIIB
MLNSQSVALSRMYWNSTNPQCINSGCPVESVIVDDHLGRYICSNCGMHLGSVFVDKEWIDSEDSAKESKNRIGNSQSELFEDLGLSTEISSDGGKKNFSHLQIKTVVTAEEKYLSSSIQRLKTLSYLVNVPNSVLIDAQDLFKQVYSRKLHRGCKLAALLLACIYLSCKKSSDANLRRSIKELCAITSTDFKSTGRAISRIESSDISITSNNNSNNSGAQLALNRLSNILRLDSSIISTAQDLILSSDRRGLCGGHPPNVIAASAIYLSCNNTRSISEIATAAFISISTIRRTSRSLQ